VLLRLEDMTDQNLDRYGTRSETSEDRLGVTNTSQ
jgi:hypothetical protein